MIISCIRNLKNNVYYSPKISELSPVGTTVIQVSAEDADGPSNGNITYSIIIYTYIPNELISVYFIFIIFTVINFLFKIQNPDDNIYVEVRKRTSKRMENHKSVCMK